MVTAIIPKKEVMLFVKEIGGILAEPLRECGATNAYLGGGYVRADRNGDIRSDDEFSLPASRFSEAEATEALEAANQILPAARDITYKASEIIRKLTG